MRPKYSVVEQSTPGTLLKSSPLPPQRIIVPATSDSKLQSESSPGSSNRKVMASSPTKEVDTTGQFPKRHKSMYEAKSYIEEMENEQRSLDKKLSTALTYLPTIVVRNIEQRMLAGKTPLRLLGEFEYEEFDGACAFFDISGFSKLASRLGKREKEEMKKRRNSQEAPVRREYSGALVRQNSLLGKRSTVAAKGMMMSRAETIAKQHEESLKLLPKILSERRGMGAETLAYAIKELFGKLVDRIQAAGGDIIKFAGDALICVWASANSTPVGVLVYHAIQCGFELSGHIENISLGRLESTGPASSLHLHVSVGSGPMRLVHVGGESGRWEYWVAGDGVKRACDGVDLSKPGEIVVCKNSYLHLKKSLKRASRMLGETLQTGNVLEGDEYHMLTSLHAPVPPIKPLKTPLVSVAAPILAYCPCNVKRAVENVSSSEDSIRDVAVVFILFNGMDKLKEAEHVSKVDGIFRSLQRSIYTYGGILRQFVVDDKGAVAVIVVGFPYFNYSKVERSSRAVSIGLDVRKELRGIHMTMRCGVTAGTVFCGNVGNAQRKEYAAVGANVNLSARFMGKDYFGRILVDAATAEAASRSYRFSPLGKTLILKGVEEPVQTFIPRSFSRRLDETDVDIVVGREKESLLCMSNDSRGKIVCFVGKSGFGKTGLLANVKRLAEERNDVVATVFLGGEQRHAAIPLYPWRKVFKMCAEPLLIAGGVSKGIRAAWVESSNGLFDPCDKEKVEEEEKKERQKEEGWKTREAALATLDSVASKEEAAEGEEEVVEMGEMGEDSELLAFIAGRSSWKDSILLGHLFPQLGLSGLSEEESTRKDQRIDGMLLSVDEFRQLALLLATIIEERLDLEEEAGGGAATSHMFIICDDIDVFDRHSLLLMHYFLDVLPSRVTVVVSSMSNTSEERASSSSLTSSKPVHNNNIVHFPFPPLNFRHERHDFFMNSLTVRDMAQIIPLTSMTLTHAIQVFENIFDQTFGQDVAKKAIALSRGNLKMARSFLSDCLSTPGLLVSKEKESDDGTTSAMCFSSSVEDGSVKLPWNSSLVAEQLDLFDVFTRELAQILSVLGVEVDMKAILSIDILFQTKGNSQSGNGGPQLMSSIKRTADDRVQILDDSLALLVAAEILICVEISSFITGKSSGTPRKSRYEWGFASSQVRAAVYSSMTFGVRQDIHASLTHYYQLTFSKDLSHFANIICYHAEASGNIELAVETSFRAVVEHFKVKNFHDAHDNLQECIRLLTDNMKTREDQVLLIGCHLRFIHLCIIMGKLNAALSSAGMAERICRAYFERTMPSRSGDESPRRERLFAKVRHIYFSCCKRDKVRVAFKCAVRIHEVLRRATESVSVSVSGSSIDLAETCAPQLEAAYNLLHTAMEVKVERREKWNEGGFSDVEVDDEWVAKKTNSPYVKRGGRQTF